MHRFSVVRSLCEESSFTVETLTQEYQGNGYGRKAFQLALDFVRTLPCGPSDICWLSYEPENEAAKKLYASFGFVEVPEYYKEGEEMPAILKL